MSEKLRKLKEDASRLIAKGKLAEAAEVYQKLVKADRKDLAGRQKLAELYGRLGRTQEAVREYQSVAGSYAADGLLLKAIAVCKIMLQLDPSHTETQSFLAELSTKRRGESGAVEVPKAMTAALAGGKRSAADIRGVPAHQVPPRSNTSPGAPVGAPPPPAIPLGTGPDARVVAAGVGQPVVIHEVAPKVAAHRTDGGEALGRAAVTRGDELAAALAAAAASVGAAPPAPSVDEPSDLAIDVTFVSGEGAPVASPSSTSAPTSAPSSTASAEGGPVVLGTSLSQEGAPLRNEAPHELPPDEPGEAAEILDADDAGDVLVLSEPASIDVDKVPPIPLFSDLPKEAFIALTERMELRVAAAGDVLVQEGERGSSMFVIIQGRVAVKRHDAQTGQDLELAELSDGAFFGEMALLSDAPRVASVVCIDDVMLFEISRELLADITREHPTVGEVMKRFHKNRLITNLLKTSPIFQPFSPSDKKELIERFKSRAVDEGSYLITRERPGEGLYVLLSGRCDVLDVNADGKEVLLAELRDGDVFGEMSMLWHKRTCASVKATTPCVVLRLPREQFNEVIMTHPQILETLTSLSEQRSKRNEELKAPGLSGEALV
ncbi:MAG: cyclic nucleotide-binding domain-containing protein [Deltaproteobacteria bacterium]|nr:cyclic nucleotide-binding domain-containing protein [Deltaproteobacteria bacterium]